MIIKMLQILVCTVIGCIGLLIVGVVISAIQSILKK